MGNKQDKRLIWIDFLRGVAMLLVIWGHVDRNNHIFFAITSPFKMPLFFAISGYLFKDRNGNVKEFIRKMTRSIVIPWAILSLVWAKIVLGLIQGRVSDIVIVCYNFLSGKDFWFIPCIIIAESILFIIKKYIHNVKAQYLTLTIISIIGIILRRFHIADFALFNIACTSQAFILFGCWFKYNEEKIRGFWSLGKVGILALLYSLLVILSLIFYPNEIIDVHLGRYYNYPLCLAMTFVSLLSWFVVSPLVRIRIPFTWIVFVGKNTIVFYICHYLARSFLIHAMNLLPLSIPNAFWGYLFRFVFISISMSLLSLVLNRWFPFVLGKKR